MQDLFDQLPYKISKIYSQSPGAEHLRSQPELDGITLYFKMDFITSFCQVCMMLFKHLYSEQKQSPLTLGQWLSGNIYNKVQTDWVMVSKEL